MARSPGQKNVARSPHHPENVEAWLRRMPGAGRHAQRLGRSVAAAGPAALLRAGPVPGEHRHPRMPAPTSSQVASRSLSCLISSFRRRILTPPLSQAASLAMKGQSETTFSRGPVFPQRQSLHFLSSHTLSCCTLHPIFLAIPPLGGQGENEHSEGSRSWPTRGWAVGSFGSQASI